MYTVSLEEEFEQMLHKELIMELPAPSSYSAKELRAAILELWCKGSFIFSGEDKTKEVTGKKAFSFYEFTPWHFDFSFFARLFENFLKLSLRTERVFAPKKGEAHG